MRKRNITSARLRFAPYKRLDVLIQAFNKMPDKTLLIAGDGPEWQRCSAIAGKNVRLLGHVSRLELRALLQRARAFVFAAREDFGIVVGEAQKAAVRPPFVMSAGEPRR